MLELVYSFDTGTTANSGRLWSRKNFDSTTLTEVTLPIRGSRRRLRGTVARDRVLLTNAFSSPHVYDYYTNRVYSAGLLAPPQAPSFSVAGGSSGDGIAYLTYVQKIDSYELVESGPSAASSTVSNSSGATRTWTIPGGAANSLRTPTHIRGYLSVGGNDPRFVWERTVGATSVEESVPTLSFGKVLNEESFVPPAAMLTKFFQERVWYTMIPSEPDRVYFSELGLPEGVGNLNWVRTLDRAPVTGLERHGESLIIFTLNSTQRIIGSPPNVEVLMVNSDIGCIAPDSVVRTFENITFASLTGVYSYNGAFRLLTPMHKDLWKSQYQTHKFAYQDSFAALDPETQSYLLSIPGPNTYRWRISYLPFEPVLGGGGESPFVSFDRYYRPEKSIGVVDGKFYSGSNDGYVRWMNDASDADDDGDSGTTTFPDGNYIAPKGVLITSKHFFMDDPGGDVEQGKTLVKLRSYVECEDYSWNVYVFGGDESAINQLEANVESETVSPSATGTKVAKCTHDHETLSESVGRGFTIKYKFGGAVDADGVKGLKWRGFGGEYLRHGPAYRGDEA